MALSTMDDPASYFLASLVDGVHRDGKREPLLVILEKRRRDVGERFKRVSAELFSQANLGALTEFRS